MGAGIRRGLLIAVALGAALLWTAVGQCAVIHVKPGGVDSNDGLTWDSARLTVQAGLSAALSGDDVWVAAGTYVERITLTDGVGLYGGFVGTETSRGQRNWAANVTILDGNQGGSVVTSPSGATASTQIDGFTIRNGSGTLQGEVSWGGGIYCSSSSPTIANNTITANRATRGSGIYCSSSSPTITNNTIGRNTATGTYGGTGGGIYCESYSGTIANNSITANNASWGGGIYCSSSSPTIANNTISGNSASSQGGGIYCEVFTSPTIANNTISGNSAGNVGGAICSYSLSSLGTIANNVVGFNSSGLAYLSGGTPVVKHNCVYNPDGYNYLGLSPGATDIQLDPLFVNRAAGDYHLTGASPCIDAGDDSVVQSGWVDMDGQARVQGAHVDIGADEVAPATLSSTLPSGWNLISLPERPVSTDPAAVFPGLPINDQLVRWDPSSLSYVGYWDGNPGDFGPLKAGEGYWLMLNQPTTITYQYYPQCGPQGIRLPVKGWHLIGQPHNGSTDVNQCLLTGQNAPPVCSAMPIYGWYPAQLRYWEVGCDGAPINDSNLLEPWHGYWLCTPSANLTLTIPPP